MKKLALVASILVLGVSGSAFAQSCGSPTGLSSGQSIPSATTCGGDTSFTDICGGATISGPANVYSWTFSSGTPSGNITVTPTGTYDTAIAIAGPAATCAAALGNCVASSDSTQTAGGAESVALSGANSAGTFYLIVTSFSQTAANQCGGYSLTVGTLPVKLQSFKID
jgi:hypothetical protein